MKRPPNTTRSPSPPGLTTSLVHTPCSALDDDRLEAPLGLLSMATFARHHGFETTVTDLSGTAPDEGLTMIEDGHFVYGFSTYSANYELTRSLAREVRIRNPRALLVAGGPHASALPHEVASHEFDIVVVGEGELALHDILRRAAAGEQLPPIIHGERPDPGDLPFPDYDLVDLSSYTRELDGERCVSVLSSRGCPYSCAFCNSIVIGAGRPVRFRSPENVTAEIRQIKERHGIRHIRFQDDIFAISEARIDALTPHLEREGIVYRCFARVNTLTAEMAWMLRRGGCIHVSLGVESGNQSLLAAMNKQQTPEQIRAALENAFEAGLRIRIFLLVGFPGETHETIEETLDLLRDCPWHEFSVYPAIAYPGTALHDDPGRFGIAHVDRDYSRYYQVGRGRRAGFTIRTEGFDEAQVQAWRDRVIEELLAEGRTWAGEARGFR